MDEDESTQLECKANDWTDGRYPAALASPRLRTPPADFGLIERPDLARRIEHEKGRVRLLKELSELTGEPEYDETLSLAENYLARMTLAYLQQPLRHR